MERFPGTPRLVKRLSSRALLANVGRRIAELRAERGFTQEALSEKLRVTPRWIQSAEAGAENLTLTTLLRFSNALKAPLDAFFVPPTTPKPGPGRPRQGSRAGISASNDGAARRSKRLAR